MRYDESDRESTNVEDRRSEGGGRMFPGGGMGIPIPIGGRGGLGIGGLLILGAIMLLFGINPLDMLTGGGGLPDVSNIPQMPRHERTPNAFPRTNPDVPGLPGQQRAPQNAGADQLGRFVRRVLADTEDVWTRVFQQSGRQYIPTTLVLFTRQTRTACGPGVSQMGPFYCPLDRRVYIDLAFYEELRRRFRSPGDFAQAYVIAHEVGHHVQNLLGIMDQVQRVKDASGGRGNALQVRVELQADCLAGVWANHNNQLHNRLEPGDIEEGLNAASQIGDDTIQRRSQGVVVPESFTHGSSAERVRWFKQGFEQGRMDACDTFRASNP